MATESPLTTVSTYGAAPEDIAAWQKAQEAGIKALEQRYANPNWFNVAAGFLKPQLGGFAASLGSASQAMGETVEKERESQLPIAKMRAELAASRIGMSKEMAASKAFADWKTLNKPMDEATYSQIVGLAPNSSVAKAAEAAYKGEREGQTLATQQQQLRSAQYGQALTAAQQKFQAGAISRDEYVTMVNAAEQAYGPTQPVKPTRPAGAPGTAFPAEAVTPAPVASAAAAVAAEPVPVPGALKPATETADGAAKPPEKAPVFNLAKSYGTPDALLDNLGMVESSNKPTAMNPDTKAMGKYQFLPETAKMLHDKGIKFNPFDEKESRAAADYYLSTLKDQNGGDWNKALAAYGGFKTKDPSEYIAKVTKGVDLGAPAKRAEDAFGNAAAQPTPAAKSTQKVVITSPFASNEMGLTPEALNAQVAANESAAKAKFDALDKVAGPDNYKPARRVIEDQMMLIKNNPELTKKVTAILNRGDLSSQIKTALEEGIGLNLGGIAGQIKLPIKKVELAGFSKREQELAQTMANNYAKIAVFQQRVGNVNPNAASNMEAQMYKDLTPTMDTTPNAALRALGHLQTDLDATQARYKFANEVYRGRHPDVAVAKNVPDRLSAILSHPAYDAVYDPFGQDHKDLEAAFQRRLAPATKKP